MDNKDLFRSECSPLSEIYHACCDIDLETIRNPSAEMGFLCVTISRMARCVNELGHDGSPLHSSITKYLIELSRHSDITIALTAVYALGTHGPEPKAVLDRLCEVITSEKRGDDHPIVTSKAIALRMLKRIDADLASQYVGTSAFKDYRSTIKHWLDSEPSEGPEANNELHAELCWLNAQDEK